VADVRFLGGPGTWWDSGMAADEPADAHSFSGGDLTRQCRELVALIRELRPQVVISYDERGGYGHPDHIRAHDVAIAAVKAAVEPTSVTDGSPWHVPKLYATVIPQTALLDVARMLSASPVEGANPFAAAATVEVPDAASLPFGVPADQITTKIDARAWAPAKIAAMRAHRSQMSQNGWFFALADATGDGLGIEHFQLLHGSPTGEGLEDDLFAGVRV
jgi:N-acetyl-1-D-myo-inositol-2-amino-2-deoxy-alpha-D-glucopyranoside deacetylase